MCKQLWILHIRLLSTLSSIVSALLCCTLLISCCKSHESRCIPRAFPLLVDSIVIYLVAYARHLLASNKNSCFCAVTCSTMCVSYGNHRSCMGRCKTDTLHSFATEARKRRCLDGTTRFKRVFIDPKALVRHLY